MKRAIDRYVKDWEKDADWRKPQYGSTFFNSGYVDYLDANYTEPPQQPARPPAGGGYPVGPNGIAYDPAMNDLDGLF